MRKVRRVLADAGFSLIEVVLALGVITFVLVAVLGMIPVGMQTFRESAADTRAAQMARAVFATLRTEPFETVRIGGQELNLAELETADWSEPGATLYADNEGALITSVGDAIFTIELRFRQQPAGLPPGEASEVHLVVRQRDGSPVSPPFVSIIEKH